MPQRIYTHLAQHCRPSTSAGMVTDDDFSKARKTNLPTKAKIR